MNWGGGTIVLKDCTHMTGPLLHPAHAHSGCCPIPPTFMSSATPRGCSTACLFGLCAALPILASSLLGATPALKDRRGGRQSG